MPHHAPPQTPSSGGVGEYGSREVLILCNSFPPETGGAPGRIYRMACTLRDAGYPVRVICCMPNYPRGKIFPEYTGKLVANELMEGIAVTRLWLVPSNSQSLWRRGFSLLSYLAMLCLAGFPAMIFRRPRKVIVSSPPLPVAFAGMFLARLLRIKVLLNISDIWPLSANTMGAMRQGLTYRLLYGMERFLYRHAAAWMGQSEEILAHIAASSTVARPSFLYRNLQSGGKVQLPALARRPKCILYAGLLGHAQGMLDLCKNLQLSGTGVQLHIYGDGSEREAIESWIAEHPKCEISLYPTLPGNELSSRLGNYGAMLVPLKVPIHGAVPSKLFFAVSAGLPVLFCAGGEGEILVEAHGLGWVSQPGNAAGLQERIRQFSALSDEGYAAMRSNILRTKNGLLNEDIQQAGFIKFFEAI